MRLINKKENQRIFSAGIEESLANVIRRYINHIPVLAISEVEISKNDSPLYDETIAHRIGLIPLKNEKIPKNKIIKLKLNSKKEGIVYSGELSGDAEVAYKKIPIVSLTKGQELDLVAFAENGRGSQHAKFSPGLIFYRNLFGIKIDKDCPKEIVESCPQDIFELKDGRVIVKEDNKCDLCEECIDFCKKRKKDSIKISPANELLITIESFGQMSVEEMLKKAIEELKKDLSEIIKKFK